MTEAPQFPSEDEVYEGTCDGPVFGSCAESYRRTFDSDNSPDTEFIRVRCGECDSVAVLEKLQT